MSVRIGPECSGADRSGAAHAGALRGREERLELRGEEVRHARRRHVGRVRRIPARKYAWPVLREHQVTASTRVASTIGGLPRRHGSTVHVCVHEAGREEGQGQH